MIQITNLSFGYGDEPLYANVNFVIGDGQKVGLVGPNGAGKSTILTIIAGKLEQLTGKVNVVGKIGIVPQEIKHDPDMEKAVLVKDYVDPDNLHEEHEIKKLFSGLELKLEITDNPQKLSGGQKTKLALARALLLSPDILLLDEPTNFMDTAGKKWVMNFLSRYEKTVIVISHDLALMNHAIDKILYVNPMLKTIDEYKGNYTSFETLKKAKEDYAARQLLIKQKHIAVMEKGLHKLTKSTKAKVKQRKRIEKAVEELPEAPPEIRKISIKLPEPANVGEVPLKVTNIHKSYGDHKVLKDVSLTIMRGERVALIGPNGAGKSTFIKILMGNLEPDSGQIYKNENLNIGYYSQEFETFDMSKTVIDLFTEMTHQNEGFSRAFLGRYMFAGNKIYQNIETLSGGEKTRLSIAILTAKNHNLLILDEPTTYLDVLSQRIILEALKEYKGAMLLVSHTPEFVTELRPNRAALFPEEKIVYWDDSLVNKVSEL
jgi:ATP-binding cassette, subfamily F, member 3